MPWFVLFDFLSTKHMGTTEETTWLEPVHSRRSGAMVQCKVLAADCLAGGQREWRVGGGRGLGQ